MYLCPLLPGTTGDYLVTSQGFHHVKLHAQLAKTGDKLVTTGDNCPHGKTRVLPVREISLTAGA